MGLQQRRLAAALVGVIVFAGQISATSVNQSPARIQFAPGPDQRWVLLAVEGAARRLNEPRCQELLSDFSNDQGQTLKEGLDAHGETLAQHLRAVWFLNGGSQRSCGQRNTSAFTVPNGRLIFLCPGLFRRPENKYDEVLIIHEILHTLGLGENPPSSDSITRQVAMRCGGA